MYGICITLLVGIRLHIRIRHPSPYHSIQYVASITCLRSFMIYKYVHTVAKQPSRDRNHMLVHFIVSFHHIHYAIILFNTHLQMLSIADGADELFTFVMVSIVRIIRVRIRSLCSRARIHTDSNRTRMPTHTHTHIIRGAGACAQSSTVSITETTAMSIV